MSSNFIHPKPTLLPDMCLNGLAHLVEPKKEIINKYILNVKIPKVDIDVRETLKFDR